MTSKDNPRQPDPDPGYWAERYLQMVEENTKHLARIRELEAEHDRWRTQGIGTALAEANTRIRALEAENTKLHGHLNELAQRRDPPGSYVIRSPGVYLAFGDDHDGGELRVVKYEAKDTIVANVDIHAGWNYVGRDIHGAPYIMVPNQAAQEAIGRVVRTDGSTVQVMRTELDALAQRRDPPGGWVSLRLHAERLARLEEQAEMANRNQQLMAPRLAQLEAQMVTKLTEVSYPSQQMAERVDQLEAWARQFDNRRFELGGGRAGVFAVQPLDRMEPKG